MPHPARSFFQIWFSGLVAAAMALLSICGGVAHASEPCTTDPNFTAAQGGGHWYYRIDRVNQRKCWFLGRPGTKVGPPAAAKAQSASKPSQSAADTPKAQEVTSNSRRGLDEPTAVARNPATVQAVDVAPQLMRELEADPQLETSFSGEAPSIWPVLAASEPQAARLATKLRVEPAHLIALLAAALGLAVVAGRLIFNHSVVFSA
jgi:hypothetical protein